MPGPGISFYLGPFDQKKLQFLPGSEDHRYGSMGSVPWRAGKGRKITFPSKKGIPDVVYPGIGDIWFSIVHERPYPRRPVRFAGSGPGEALDPGGVPIR